jgi:hypothetical protein
MTPRVPISCGELIDKITILEIKSEPLLGTPRIWSRMAVLRCSAALAPVSCHAAAERRAHSGLSVRQLPGDPDSIVQGQIHSA